MSYEELCRAHIEALIAAAAAQEVQTELSQRVSTWRQRIDPVLRDEENRCGGGCWGLLVLAPALAGVVALTGAGVRALVGLQLVLPLLGLVRRVACWLATMQQWWRTCLLAWSTARWGQRAQQRPLFTHAFHLAAPQVCL